MSCPRCGKDTEQDGVWPIKHKGRVVGGCYGCFEMGCDELWWQVVTGTPWWQVPYWFILRTWERIKWKLWN